MPPATLIRSFNAGLQQKAMVLTRPSQAVVQKVLHACVTVGAKAFSLLHRHSCTMSDKEAVWDSVYGWLCKYLPHYRHLFQFLGYADATTRILADFNAHSPGMHCTAVCNSMALVSSTCITKKA